MSNPLGRFLNRDAQNLTAEIDGATDMPSAVPEVSTVTDASSVVTEVSAVVPGVMNEMQGVNAPVNSAVNGAAVLRTTRDGELAKRVITDVSSETAPDVSLEVSDVLSEATDVGGVADAEIIGGDASFDGDAPFGEDIPSPEVVSEEFAHERKLARDEGDILETNPEMLYEALNDSGEIRGGGTQESQESQEDVQSVDDDTRGDRSEIISGFDVDADRGNSSMVDEKFVGGERELAKNTMQLVEQAIAGKGETPIVDILTLYEMGANAIRQDDERVG